jgi:hypothetical protein
MNASRERSFGCISPVKQNPRHPYADQPIRSATARYRRQIVTTTPASQSTFTSLDPFTPLAILHHWPLAPYRRVPAPAPPRPTPLLRMPTPAPPDPHSRSSRSPSPQENGLQSLWQHPYRNIRRGCRVHAAPTTWLGHPRLIRRALKRPGQVGRPGTLTTKVFWKHVSTRSQAKRDAVVMTMHWLRPAEGCRHRGRRAAGGQLGGLTPA